MQPDKQLAAAGSFAPLWGTRLKVMSLAGLWLQGAAGDLRAVSLPASPAEILGRAQQPLAAFGQLSAGCLGCWVAAQGLTRHLPSLPGWLEYFCFDKPARGVEPSSAG